MTVSSPDPDFTGSEDITFTVKDSQDKQDTHVMTIQAVLLNTPIVSDIPDVEITKNRTVTLNLNDYMVIFPDSLERFVTWSVNPVSDSKVFVDLNSITGQVNVLGA